MDHVGFYMIHAFLDSLVKGYLASFSSANLKLIISFLDHQPLLVLTMLILVDSAQQAPYLACLQVLRLAIRPRSIRSI